MNIVSYVKMCVPSRNTPNRHFTWFKAIINTPLRFLQLWYTDNPILLASIFINDKWTGKYKLTKVQCTRP